MKIALVKVSSYQKWYKIPSFALGYLSAVLEKNGIEVKIFDGRYFDIKDKQLIDDLCGFSPEIIGFSAMTHEIKRTAKIAEKVKERVNVKVVFGGCHLSALPEETMEEFLVIDYGVLGEGEYTLLDIVTHARGQMRIEEIDGVIFRKDGKMIRNKPRELISDLDLLPFAAFDQYYRKGIEGLNDKSIYPILSSRGCPFSCSFCMRILGRKVRYRSAENIITEIELAIDKYGIQLIDFHDEIFLFNNERTNGLLTKFIESGLSKKIKWSGLTRVDLIDQKIIELAKEAGCYRIELGVESGNDGILKRINKNTTVSQIERAVDIIKKSKIKISSYYILGHPGETEATMKETINLAVKLNTDYIAVGIMVPYPGTEIYQWAKEGKFGYRLRSADWDTYDKYGGSALEFEGLSFKKILNFQRKAYLDFYLKNLRFIDLIKFIFSRWAGILNLLFKKYAD
ncbi:MAG: radical SAM protein [Candidatus Omnitrophica bacterium]|nr:radical SAM protein [Candidatus Omnitrophota bacterium]